MKPEIKCLECNWTGCLDELRGTMWISDKGMCPHCFGEDWKEIEPEEDNEENE